MGMEWRGSKSFKKPGHGVLRAVADAARTSYDMCMVHGSRHDEVISSCVLFSDHSD